MNVPRTEDLPDPRMHIDLPTDGPKITKEIETEEEDGYICIYKFNKEDATIGGILQEELIRMEEVLIATYENRHPLFYDIHVYIKCVKTTIPDQVLKKALILCMERIQRTKIMIVNKIKEEYKKSFFFLDEIDKQIFNLYF